MKRVFTVLMATAVLCTGYAATPVGPLAVPPAEVPVLNAKNIMLPVGKTGKTISLLDLATISIKDFEALKGQEMSLVDKAGFKIAQRQLRNKLEDDGTVKKSVAKKLAKSMADGTTGFHLGGFALGFFAGLIGVVIAYVLDDEKKKNRVKWASTLR